MTEEQIQVLINQAEDHEEVKFDKQQIKRMIAQIKNSLNINLELRLKHKDDPEQFLDSEAQVHIDLK